MSVCKVASKFCVIFHNKLNLACCLKRTKKYAKATHNTWAVVLSDGGAVKNDDGESGAGAVILKMLERAGLVDHVVVVTRWYGGVHLGGDRFAHVVTCVRRWLEGWRAGL